MDLLIPSQEFSGGLLTQNARTLFHLRGMADASEHQRFLTWDMSQGHGCQAWHMDWMLWQKHMYIYIYVCVCVFIFRIYVYK